MKLSTRQKGPKPCRLTSLPTEIRLLIYTHYFANSQILYSRRRTTRSTLLNRKRPAYLRGPSTIAILLTSKSIHHEALPILLNNLTLTISRTELFTALRQIHTHTTHKPRHHKPIPPFLATLLTHTRHLTFSRISRYYPHHTTPTDRTHHPSPTLPHLRTITIFGFWPALRSHLSSTDFVSPARRWWHLEHQPRWRVPRWMQTLDFEVDLLEAARSLHWLFDRDGGTVEVGMRVWSLGETAMLARPWEAEVLEIQVDLDDGERWWAWERVAFPEMRGRGRWGFGCMWPYAVGREWEGFVRETDRRKGMAVEEFEKGGEAGEGVKGFGRKGRRLFDGQVLDEETMRADDKGEVTFAVDEEGNELFWGMTQAEIDALGDELEENEDVAEGGAGFDGDGSGNSGVGAAVTVTPLQKELVLLNGSSATLRRRPGSEPQHSQEGLKDWATITDNGDWQSARSVDFAFNQWDGALEV